MRFFYLENEDEWEFQLGNILNSSDNYNFKKLQIIKK